METEKPMTSDDVLTIADWWSSLPSDLAKLLNVEQGKDEPDLSPEDQCAAILKQWIKDSSAGDQLKSLIDILESNGYYYYHKN